MERVHLTSKNLTPCLATASTKALSNAATGGCSDMLLCIVGLLIILMLPLAVDAQVAGGSIAGRVTDSNGAVLPGAQVAIRNTATGVTTQLVANDEGV